MTKSPFHSHEIVYRDDNVVTGDVLGKEFDIHIQIDSRGSIEEFTKTDP